MNSPAPKQNMSGGGGVYGLGSGDGKSVSLRNQNSASLSSAKNNKNGPYGDQMHATGSQRVRDKLLMNSGGLAMGQNQQHGVGTLVLPKSNGSLQLQKSP